VKFLQISEEELEVVLNNIQQEAQEAISNFLS